MIAVTIDGYSLGALIVIGAVVVVVILIIARLVKREQDVRLTRVGVFVERERYDTPQDRWTPDPLSDEEQETIIAPPIPPPTFPPPPKPQPKPRPKPSTGEDTEAWPQRKEEEA